jgi:uncharacterized protein (TIGR02246 family)
MNDVEKINALNADFEKALREGDGEKCAAMCDENAVMMPPNKKPIEGREAIKQHFANLGSDSTVSGETLSIEVSGGLAYQRSRATWNSNGQQRYTDSLDVLKQQDDGTWLFIASAWNSSEGFDQA